VLSRSAKIYKDIRELLKAKEALRASDFYEKIEQAMLLSEDKGAEVNAAQHVWGYVNDKCSDSEKNRYTFLLKNFISGKGSASALKKHLLKLAQKQGEEYLLDSLYFYVNQTRGQVPCLKQ
jgi:UV DNA damage endonuclease